MVKKLTLLSMLFVGLIAHAQQEKIKFSYDEAGNQTKRAYCFNCAGKNGNTVKDFSEIKDEELLQFFPNDVISYYPNPVKEELFLKWELTENKKVTSIAIFSMSGTLVLSYENLTNINTKTIPFYNVPEGVYTVILSYSDGDQKTIKIVKK
jgi:hypothetical protein